MATRLHNDINNHYGTPPLKPALRRLFLECHCMVFFHINIVEYITV